MKNEHISLYLNFVESRHSKRMVSNNRQEAILPSGSKIYRNQTNKGLSFQLFLNADEYKKIREHQNEFWRAHFYGGNYIYLPPSSHYIIPIAKIMGWKNEDKSTHFNPHRC